MSSLEAANVVLERWANGASDGGNDQCDIQIVFEDGFRYHGHYSLTKSPRRVSLARHVRKHLTALASSKGAKKSSQLAGEPVISVIGASLAESARIALDHYNI
ncbi:MAG TPA: hypothetical protein VJ577_19010 [Burkholderiaceae bacterium]|nr:hypothetical protein [Burkholderiaceae bacterium]